MEKEEYLELLRRKANELQRLPKKSDFENSDVVKIKSLFGPWPHALSNAGLIESKEEVRKQKNIERRKRARQKMKEEKKNE